MLISALQDPRPAYRLRQRLADALLPRQWAERVDKGRDESLQLAIYETQKLFSSYIRPYAPPIDGIVVSEEKRKDHQRACRDKESAAIDRIEGARQAVALGEVGGMRLMGPIRGFLRQALCDHREVLSYEPHLRFHDLQAIRYCLVALPTYGMMAANALEDIAPFCSLRDRDPDNLQLSNDVRLEAITAIGKLGRTIIEYGNDRYSPYLKMAAKAVLNKHETYPDVSVRGLETIEALAVVSIVKQNFPLIDFFQQSRETIRLFTDARLAQDVQERARVALQKISRTNSAMFDRNQFPVHGFDHS